MMAQDNIGQLPVGHGALYPGPAQVDAALLGAAQAQADQAAVAALAQHQVPQNPVNIDIFPYILELK